MLQPAGVGWGGVSGSHQAPGLLKPLNVHSFGAKAWLPPASSLTHHPLSPRSLAAAPPPTFPKSLQPQDLPPPATSHLRPQPRLALVKAPPTTTTTKSDSPPAEALVATPAFPSWPRGLLRRSTSASELVLSPLTRALGSLNPQTLIRGQEFTQGSSEARAAAENENTEQVPCVLRGRWAGQFNSVGGVMGGSGRKGGLGGLPAPSPPVVLCAGTTRSALLLLWAPPKWQFVCRGVFVSDGSSLPRGQALIVSAFCCWR